MLRFGFFCFVLKDGATKSDEFSEIPNCLRPPAPSFSENYYYKIFVMNMVDYAQEGTRAR